MAGRANRDLMRPILPTQGQPMTPAVKPTPMPAGNPAYNPQAVQGAGLQNSAVIGSGLMQQPAAGGALPAPQASAVPNQQAKPIATGAQQPVNPVIRPPAGRM
jgi:hypothetical protein